MKNEKKLKKLESIIATLSIIYGIATYAQIIGIFLFILGSQIFKNIKNEMDSRKEVVNILKINLSSLLFLIIFFITIFIGGGQGSFSLSNLFIGIFYLVLFFLLPIIFPIIYLKIEKKHSEIKHNNKLFGETLEKEMKEMLMIAQIAYKSPSFKAVYDFQQEFLPSIFFHKTDQFLNDVLVNDFFKYIDLFNVNGKLLLLDKENLDIEIRNYNDNQYILRISIIDLQSVTPIKWKAPLCDTIYLYFNKQNPKENLYFTVENSSGSEEYKYMLCAKNTEGRRLLFGSKSIDGNNFIEDVKFLEIEKRLKVIPDETLTNKNLFENELTSNEIISFYNKVTNIVNSFDSNFDEPECISFALLINDIKVSTHNQSLSFTEREDIFVKWSEELSKGNINKCKLIRDSYSTILNSPNDYVIGQSFNMMPIQDIEIVNKLLQSPYGISLLHFIDRINYGFNDPEDTKNIVIGDYLSNASKTPKLLILRGELWSEIVEFVKE